MSDTTRNRDAARDVFDRLGEVYLRGHEAWMAHVRRLEDYFLAGGRQWLPSDKAVLESEGRPTYEVDVVKPAITAAVGYQIANRVDVSFVPRGGRADEASAKLMSKVVRQVLDNANWRHAETDAFTDGLIQQRGYIDVRMDYEMSDLGLPSLRVVDPLDGIPDPDGKSYDPDSWADWHETRWLTAAEIEQNYGRDAARDVVGNAKTYVSEDPHGTEQGIDRSGFDERLPGMYHLGRGWMGKEGAWRRYRVVERQSNVYENVLVARWPTGDVRVVEGNTRESIGWLIDQGIPVFKRRMRRVRWSAAAPEVMLFEKLSPYDHITAVPYFPYFRRGRSVGMVDNLVSVQDMLNKFISQYGHVVNGSANSGWQGEANQLANMTDAVFTAKGATTGLVLLRKPGSKAFEKIQPNQIPTGLDKMIEFAYRNAQIVSGVDDAMQGLQKPDLSGVAIQSLQFAAQQKLAMPLDNLSRSRKMVVERVVECVQKFMGAERVMRITEEDSYGVKRNIPHTLNERRPNGEVLNDLTMGQYDIVLSEQPAQVTFDNSQFEQMKAMKELGVPLSNARLVRASNLADKSDIADELMQSEGKSDPVAEAEANLKIAQAELAKNTAVAKSIEAQFSAVTTAREIVLTPAAASLADALLLSGGFVDKNAAPIIPQAPAGVAPMATGPENTNPLTPTNPANPAIGLERGLSATAE